MSRKIIPIIAVSLSFLGMAACGTVSTPTNAVTILPKDCRMLVGEQMPLTLDGQVPPNAVVSWESDGGSLIFAPPALNALFIAPPQPAFVTISVTISSGTPSMQIPITRQCIITSPDDPPQSVPSTGSDAAASSPLSQVTEDAPVAAVQNLPATVIISEVMANPCGPLEARKWNEYVELYNYGDQPVDVGGWWLADIGEAGTPDQLVSWSQRNPNEALGKDLILNSTIIPARGFALVLSPIYTQGTFPYTMPYRFPSNIVILTIAGSRSLGDDFFAIIGDGQGLDVLVLYKGGTSVIQEVVSTYGTPKLDRYVTNIHDDNRDNLPLNLHECSSAERVLPTGSDSFDNWREVSNGSPGEAPY